MQRFYKESVGERQMCRRVAKELKNTIEGLNSNLNQASSLVSKTVVHSDTVNIISSTDVTRSNLNQTSSLVSKTVVDSDSVNIISSTDVTNSKVSSENLINSNNISEIENDTSIESDFEMDLELISCLDNASNSNKFQKNSYDLHGELKRWAIRNKVTHSTVTDLLHVLVPVHPELPLSSKTLLNTPTTITLKKKLTSGSYVHFGLENYLKFYISTNDSIISNDILISFNIDGLPLFKSSSVQFWPILGLIVNSSIKVKPFAIGVFCGNSKPSPLADYLNDFINDLKFLLENGLTFKDKEYRIHVHSFICDAPARAFIKCIKSHNGYSGCDKCTEEGDYFKHRMIFNNILAPRRSDQSFLLKSDQNHHTGISPLEVLNIGLVSKFPIDSMHCLYLGVMKKLLLTWICGDLRVRLCGRDVTNISENLIFYGKFVVSEFNRKPRSLSEVARFKATEFRTLLLYLGVLVLKNIDKAMYEHFLLLHSSVTILLSKRHLANFGCDVPRKLLDCFITHSKDLYGLEFLIYNVHVLCHLSEEARLFGPLDQISAFPFENYLNEIKKSVKSPNKPLEQLFCRLTEANTISVINDSVTKKCEIQHFNGPLLHLSFNSTKQYNKLKYNNIVYTVEAHSNVNCYCLNNEYCVIKINNIVNAKNEYFLIGQKFTSYESFYNYPFESKSLNICIVSKLLQNMELFNLDSIITKCMLFPLDPPNNSKWLSFPLL
ncbi:uncharacterized protein LOC126889458 [Diabrotica virgifera virgifera]|uniref:Transposase domain-containing protein n=1 Tax=Diabrotica virgifera virgifera TaxID=50390 RepID=A0ABM5KU66_DIAVI|nr:uncharacterized protein LOC126889458 [Diabrotica virgifera virgifera]